MAATIPVASTHYLYSNNYTSREEFEAAIQRCKGFGYAEIARTVAISGDVKIKLRRVPRAPSKYAPGTF